MRDRLDRHDSFVRHLRRRVTAKLAKRPFVAGFRRDRQFPFKDNLRQRRHLQVDGSAFHHVDRFTGKPAGDFQLKDAGPRFEL